MRTLLIFFHQERAAELYEFARWVNQKAIRARARYAIGEVVQRRNQFTLEADLAAKHAATARILMGVE